jgi:hypothetical protein
MTVTNPEVEAFVERELDEALRDFEQILPPEEFAILRASLRHELLFHPEGQARVREAMPDPSVDRSGTAVRQRTDAEEEEEEDVAKKGRGR